MSKLIFSVEGNIGAGKSTMMNLLRAYFSSYKKVCFIDEPVDEWLAMKNNDGKNLLETFYSDTKRWSYTFQNVAYITRMNRLVDAMMSDCDVIIMDRSLNGDMNTFTRMLEEDGCLNKIEMEAYHKWNEFFMKRFGSNANIFHLYLKCSPDMAYSRISCRGRNEEKNISIDYLTRLHNCHDDWLLNKNINNVFVMDVQEDFCNTIREKYVLGCITNYISGKYVEITGKYLLK